MREINIPWAAWFGDGAVALDFSENWEVQVHAMRDAPALNPAEVNAASTRTIGSPPLRELAASCRTVAIAVDDLSRPTPAHLILPAVIAELIEAGIQPENISFVISLGSHTALTEDDLIKKLGKEIVARHRVVNHDCHGELVDIGVSVGKVPVKINAEFMAADLKILLGSVVPHAFAGYSGGAKMVLPGLSNIESIEWTHKAVMMGLRGKAGQSRHARRQPLSRRVRARRAPCRRQLRDSSRGQQPPGNCRHFCRRHRTGASRGSQIRRRDLRHARPAASRCWHSQCLSQRRRAVAGRKCFDVSSHRARELSQGRRPAAHHQRVFTGHGTSWTVRSQSTFVPQAHGQGLSQAAPACRFHAGRDDRAVSSSLLGRLSAFQHVASGTRVFAAALSEWREGGGVAVREYSDW
ncbi:DUF2088 domain-containing protein [candidate division KSB1 bacterium]|nr:DUF2088 domain-containing protein [candidate division KSB1 bacterium]